MARRWRAFVTTRQANSSIRNTLFGLCQAMQLFHVCRFWIAMVRDRIGHSERQLHFVETLRHKRIIHPQSRCLMLGAVPKPFAQRNENITGRHYLPNGFVRRQVSTAVPLASSLFRVSARRSPPLIKVAQYSHTRPLLSPIPTLRSAGFPAEVLLSEDPQM
jgi:hypothetical protein